MKFRIFCISSSVFEAWDMNQQDSKREYLGARHWGHYSSLSKKNKKLHKENYIMKNYVLCILYQIFLMQRNEGE